MDRATLRQHLAEVQRHVAAGQRHLVRQEDLIADLERDGEAIQRLQIEETAKTLGQGGNAGPSARRRRATLLQHLALAMRHIVEGQAHLLKQELLVAKLDNHGHDTHDAMTIFATLKQARHLPRQADLRAILK